MKKEEAKWYEKASGKKQHKAENSAKFAAKNELKKQRKEEKTQKKEEWTICGSLCTANDILVKQYPLSEVKIGDVLLFERTGAYSMSEGMALFLSRELPAVFALKTEGELKNLRPRIAVDELILT